MTTLIFQVDIGKGRQWLSEEAINPIRNIFIPSVKKYAKKFNYDYKLITASEYEKNGGDFLFLATREKHFAFERYFHFKEKYDQIVYIDNDVYVVDKAQPLPPIKGLMNAPEPESKTTYVFRESHNLESTIKYYNSGVIFMDKDTAIHLQHYMLERMKNKKRAKGKNTDQMMLNEYILDYPEVFTEIGSEWNYMPFLPNSKRINNFNFFHFVGVQGKLVLKSLLKKGMAPDVATEAFLEENI